MIATLGIAILSAVIIAGYLQMSQNEYKLAQRTLMLQSAMNLAEGGLEEGMDAIVQDAWSGWTAVGSNGYYKKVDTMAFSDARSVELRIYIEDYSTLPILAAEGRIVDASGDEIFRQVRVDLERASLFANGLLAKRTISFSGNNVSVDAYDSNVGLWNETTNRLDQGTVASLSVDNGALSVGNGDIWGYVATGGGTPDVGASGSIQGVGSTDRIDDSRVSDSFYANLLDVSAPTGTSSGINYTVDYLALGLGSVGATGTDSNPEVYHIPSYTMTGSDALDIVGPTVMIVDGDISVTGLAEINILAPDGSLEIYADGDVQIGGNGVFNESMNPEAFLIWGTQPTGSSQSISVKGNGDTAMVVYAPNADVTVVGNGGVSGAVVGETIDITGNAAFHYDVNLEGFRSDGRYSVGRWRELRAASERLDFTDRAALASAISPL